MEYCRFDTVASFLKNVRRFTEDEIKDIMACCVLGLMCVHSKGIIHRVLCCNYSFPLGYQRSEHLHFTEGRRKTGRFRTLCRDNPLPFDSQGCLRHILLDGAWTNQWPWLSEERHLVAGRNGNRVGGGQEPLPEILTGGCLHYPKTSNVDIQGDLRGHYSLAW